MTEKAGFAPAFSFLQPTFGLIDPEMDSLTSATRSDLAHTLHMAVVTLLSAALVVTPPSLVALPYADHDSARIVQIVFLMAASIVGAAALVLDASALTKPEGRLGRAVCALMGVLALAAILHADMPRYAAGEAGLLGALALTAVSTSAVARRSMSLLLAVAVLASLTYSFATAVRYGAAIATETPLLREHLFPGYSNYRFFNHVQSVTIPLLMAASFAAPNTGRLRQLAIPALVLEFCWLFFSGGRATLLGIAMATVAVAWVGQSAAVPWIRRIAAYAGFGFLLYLGMFKLAPELLGLGGDFFVNDFAARTSADVGAPRRYLWELALKYMGESPLLGIGPMHYAAIPNVEAAHPHNFYLQVAAEWGLPLALLVLAVAIAAAAGLSRAARTMTGQEEKQLGLSLVAFFCAVAVDAVFSGNFVMPMSQLWISFAAGLSIGYVASLRTTGAARQRDAGTAVRGSYGAAALGLACCLAIWHMAWPEMRDPEAHVERTRSSVVHNVRDNPRLWSHGWIR